MAKRLKLKDALDRHKQVDHKLEQQRRLEKKAAKRKRAHAEKDQVEGAEPIKGLGKDIDEVQPSKKQKTSKDVNAVVDVAGSDSGSDSNSDQQWDTDEDEEGGNGVVASLVDSETSDSEAGPDLDQTIEDHEDEDADGDIPLSDIESLASEDKGDIIPHQRLTINNKPALLKAYKSFALPADSPFTANQSVTTAEPVTIADIDDDLSRELAFYKQCLDAVTRARSLLKAEGAPFTRPTDYFAEMVKTEEHMGRIKQKIVGEAASKRAAAEARKQRDLKKFGKQVQVAKLQERDRTKRDTLDKIKMLKKKRSGAEISSTNEEDMFDVALDDAADSASKDRKRSGPGSGKPKMQRSKRDEKHGFGGRKRFAKSNDATSTSDTRSFSQKKMKAGGHKGSTRPGKSRRAKTK